MQSIFSMINQQGVFYFLAQVIVVYKQVGETALICEVRKPNRPNFSGALQIPIVADEVWHTGLKADFVSSHYRPIDECVPVSWEEYLPQVESI